MVPGSAPQYIDCASHPSAWLNAGSQWRSRALQFIQPEDSLFSAGATHFLRGLQANAEGGAVGVAENLAAFIFPQLYAAHTSGFAVGHTGDRAGDGGSDAAGAAAVTACGHGESGIGCGSVAVCLFWRLPARCTHWVCTCVSTHQAVCAPAFRC